MTLLFSLGCSVLDELLKHFEVVRERFPGAAGILNGNWNILAGSERECHSHSVVVVCVYGRHI